MLFFLISLVGDFKAKSVEIWLRAPACRRVSEGFWSLFLPLPGLSSSRWFLPAFDFLSFSKCPISPHIPHSKRKSEAGSVARWPSVCLACSALNVILSTFKNMFTSQVNIFPRQASHDPPGELTTHKIVPCKPKCKIINCMSCRGKGGPHPHPVHLPENWHQDVQVLAVFSRWGSREVWKLAKLPSPTAKERQWPLQVPESWKHNMLRRSPCLPCIP